MKIRCKNLKWDVSYVYIVNFLECKKNWDKQSKINVIFCLRKLDNFLKGYKWKWFSSIALISSKLWFLFYVFREFTKLMLKTKTCQILINKLNRIVNQGFPVLVSMEGPNFIINLLVIEITFDLHKFKQFFLPLAWTIISIKIILSNFEFSALTTKQNANHIFHQQTSSNPPV